MKSFSFPSKKLKINLEPLPYRDLKPISPLNDYTIFSQITSPRPIP